MTFTVLGVPVPQGSMRAFMPKRARFPVVTSDNQRTKPWKSSVSAAAFEAKGGEDASAIAEPVEVAIVFYLPRPKSAPKRVTQPQTKPDLDKLVRAILDACTDAGVWVDDAQVVTLLARKTFAGGLDDKATGVPRAVVSVKRVEARDVEIGGGA